MLKKLVLAMLLATSPEGAVPHTANVVTDVPITTMGDCKTFTVAGTVVRKVGDTYRFVVILNCNERRDSVPKEDFKT